MRSVEGVYQFEGLGGGVSKERVGRGFRGGAEVVRGTRSRLGGPVMNLEPRAGLGEGNSVVSDNKSDNDFGEVVEICSVDMLGGDRVVLVGGCVERVLYTFWIGGGNVVSVGVCSFKDGPGGASVVKFSKLIGLLSGLSSSALLSLSEVNVSVLS